MFKSVFNKKWKVTVAVLVVLLFTGGIYYYFNNQSTPQATKYVTATVSKGTISETVSASGNFVITRQKNLNFKASGKISQLSVKAGDTVKAGQELGRIDTMSLDATVAQDQISLNTAVNNYNNRNKNAPTSSDVANLQEQINVAQIKVNTDKANLANYNLNSPVSGCVRTINNSVGDNISSSGPTAFMVISSDCNTTPFPSPKNVNFSVSGKLTEIDVNVGDSVNSGQLLAKLDNTTATNQLASSQSSLNQAINNFNNRNKSLPNNFDVANLQAQIDTAQLKLDTDKNNLNNAILSSDIDGLVTSVNNAVGDTVSGSGNTSTVATSTSSNSSSSSQNTGVVTIIDPSSMVINLTVPESDIVKISNGQIVQVTVDALGGKQFVGKVSSVDAVGTNSSNVVSFGVKISVNKLDSSIKPGMSASSNIIVNSKDNILTAPIGAVKTVSGQKTVQTYNNSNLQTVAVNTGISDDTNIEITNGLSEGDLIVTSTVTSINTSRSATASTLFNLGGITGSGSGRTGGGAGAAGGNRTATPTPAGN